MSHNLRKTIPEGLGTLELLIRIGSRHLFHDFVEKSPEKPPWRPGNRLKVTSWHFSNIDCTMMNEGASEGSASALFLASNPRVLRSTVVELWQKWWGYSDPQQNPAEHQGLTQEAGAPLEYPGERGRLLHGPKRDDFPMREARAKLLTTPHMRNTWWLRAFWTPLRITPEKGPYLDNGEELKRTFGILVPHLERPNVWHQPHSPTPLNVNLQKFSQSALSWIPESPGAASLKFQYLDDGEELRRTFGILVPHLERPNVWHHPHSPTPPNVNPQNFGQSEWSCPWE